MTAPEARGGPGWLALNGEGAVQERLAAGTVWSVGGSGASLRLFCLLGGMLGEGVSTGGGGPIDFVTL